MALMSVVLPAYNEEQNIANTANTLAQLEEIVYIYYDYATRNNGLSIFGHDGVYEITQNSD